jgi:ABC-type multidrug transport system fused ATPase/permease subunit
VNGRALSAGRPSARSTLQAFRSLSRSLGVSPWPPPGVVLLGLAAALFEVLAITLVVSMLFALMAQSAQGALVGGVVNAVRSVAGGAWSGLAVAVLLLVMLKAGAALLYTRLSIRAKGEINARVLAAAHARLVDMPYARLLTRGQGDLINTSATDAWQLANAGYLLSRIAINLCMILIFSLCIFVLSWQIGLLALAGGAALAGAGHLIARLAREHGAAVRKDIERLYTRLLAAVHGARIIRAFAQEEEEKRRVAGAIATLRANTERAEATRALSGPLNEIGYVALLIGMVALAAQLELAQASALTAIALLYRLAPQIRELENNRLSFASLYAPLRAVADLVRTPKSSTDAGEDGFDRPLETIRFDGVTFQPLGAAAPVLSNASFEIPAGRITALVGPSGSGKTSVVNLLLRLYAPDQGAIWVGGARLDQIGRRTWLSNVAAAGQDLELIDGTIAENLRLGAPEASEAELHAAARDASALSFIERLPGGFGAWVGSFGYNLSGGERQRLSLARALLHKPKLLLLDESTSAVERAIETEILRNVVNARQDLTILLITHRLNPAARVDHIVRLDRGKVAEPNTAHPPLEERRA